MADSKGQLAGDLAAAAVSATLVAPTVTLLDRALTEKASSNKPLLRGLRAHAIAALRHPGRFVFSRPFGLVWTLYAATYAVANATDTVTRETHPSSSASITFVSTFAVNVPLGVWKDIRFAQLFGNSPDPIAKTALRSTRAVSTAATATFLVRDAATIFGSFTLAPWCSDLIPDSLTSHPHSKTVITQMVVPVLSQLVATPIHLIGLDLYNRQYAVPWSDRLAVTRSHLPSATVMRCVRIVPAFGFGCLTNMELRSFFHRAFAIPSKILS